MTWLLLAWMWLASAGTPAAGPMAGAGRDVGARIDALAELTRLDGHRLKLSGDAYAIEDVAGEGAPVVGVVERRGADLHLVAGDGRVYRLAGILARPRIAGPGYKIWALGEIRATAGPVPELRARRLGVLAPPAHAATPAHAAK